VSRLLGFLAVVVLATLVTAERASAESIATTGTGDQAVPCDERLAPGDYEHDGFFLRAEAGVTFFRALVDAPSSPAGRTRITGFGESSSISAGGTPLRGLVVGGRVWTTRVSPSFVEHGVHVTPDDDSVKETLARIGPFADWYPDPMRGFHVQLGLELAIQVESDVKGTLIKPGNYGPAATLGLGYEWFVSKQFSLGFVARMAFGYGTRSLSGPDEHTLWEAPELALAYTYH
jgi:hypothetical protein